MLPPAVSAKRDAAAARYAVIDPVLSFLHEDIEETVKAGRVNVSLRLNHSNYDGMRKQVSKNVQYILENWHDWAVIVKTSHNHFSPLVRSAGAASVSAVADVLSHNYSRRPDLNGAESFVLNYVLQQVRSPCLPCTTQTF